MLIRLITLHRQNASDPPVEKIVAIDPESIARIEEASETKVSQIWCDGMNGKPYLVCGTVDDVLQRIQTEIDRLCAPVG